MSAASPRCQLFSVGDRMSDVLEEAQQILEYKGSRLKEVKVLYKLNKSLSFLRQVFTASNDVVANGKMWSEEEHYNR